MKQEQALFKEILKSQSGWKEYSKLRGKMVLDRAGEASIGQILLHIVGQNKKLIFISNQRQMGRVTVCLLF